MPRRTATNSISLFPFLAVLLCAMGALIVLLVILTHQIREDARRIVVETNPPPSMAAPAAPDAPAPSETPTPAIVLPRVPVVAPIDPNLKLRARLGELRQRREELQSKLAAQNDKLAGQAARKKSVVQKTRSVLLAIDADTSRFKARSAVLEQRRTAIGDKKSEVTELVAELKAAKQQAAGAPAKLQIVPYDGRSGTARKPILIECTAEAIRFMPENVALNPADIEGFDPRFNPLLAGASALRNYWSVHGGSRSARPYILLVVRTDGIIAYYAARSLLKPLGRATGYILVGEGQEIAYPELDPLAQEVCRKAVAEALELRSAAQFLTSNRDDQFQNNLFTVNPLEHDPTRPDQDDDALFPVHPRPNATGPVGRGAFPTASGALARNEPRGTAGYGLYGDPSRQTNSFNEPGDNGIRGRGGPRAGTNNGIGGPGSAGLAFDSGSDRGRYNPRQVPSRFQNQHHNSQSLPATGREQLGHGEQRSGPHNDSRNGTGSSNKNSGQSHHGRLGGSEGMPRGKGHLDSEGRTLDPGSQSRTNPPSQLSSQFINRLRNNLPPRAVSPGSQSGRRPGLGLGGPGSGSIPLPFGDASKPPQKKHWGKSSSTALISLEHNLPITVSHDVIQVSGQPALLVGPDGLDGIILKDVFSAIAQEARSWGPPPENFFWTPHIQVAVTPGGEYTFTRLQSALEQAGMRVSDHLDFDARITPAVEQPDAPPSH